MIKLGQLIEVVVRVDDASRALVKGSLGIASLKANGTIHFVSGDVYTIFKDLTRAGEFLKFEEGRGYCVVSGNDLTVTKDGVLTSIPEETEVEVVYFSNAPTEITVIKQIGATYLMSEEAQQEYLTPIEFSELKFTKQLFKEAGLWKQ